MANDNKDSKDSAVKSAEQPTTSDVPVSVADLQKQLASQAKEVEQLKRLLQKSTPGVAKDARVPALVRDGLPPDKLPLVADYEVTFQGPDADKWLQPVRVEAIGGPQAVARVVSALRIDAPEHRFQTKYLGKTFRVTAKSGKAVEGFPRRVNAPSEAEATRLANQRTETDAELVATEV